MLGVDGREEQWCAACATVGGSLELRVGEPRRRGLLRRRDIDREGWLLDHDFLPVLDAWCFSGHELGDDACVGTLAAALEHGLGADPETPLQHVLTHPGSLAGEAFPDPGAPLEEHLTVGLRGLVLAGDGRITIQSGRPAALRAWVWVVADKGGCSSSARSPASPSHPASRGPSRSRSTAPRARRQSSRAGPGPIARRSTTSRSSSARSFSQNGVRPRLARVSRCGGRARA